jgi:hypothetical protein
MEWLWAENFLSSIPVGIIQIYTENFREAVDGKFDVLHERHNFSIDTFFEKMPNFKMDFSMLDMYLLLSQWNVLFSHI